jgi:hypothetical protein
MKDFAKRGVTLGLAVSAALALAGAGFALYSCDGFADAAAQAADASRMDDFRAAKYKIRGPLGWVDYEFVSNDIGRLERDYVLGTDRTVRVKHYWRYTNDNLRKKLEAGGITITDYHSTSKAGEYCWLEFNLKEITEFKLL